jgi:hypothetical protein
MAGKKLKTKQKAHNAAYGKKYLNCHHHRVKTKTWNLKNKPSET